MLYKSIPQTVSMQTNSSQCSFYLLAVNSPPMLPETDVVGELYS